MFLCLCLYHLSALCPLKLLWPKVLGLEPQWMCFSMDSVEQWILNCNLDEGPCMWKILAAFMLWNRSWAILIAWSKNISMPNLNLRKGLSASNIRPGNQFQLINQGSNSLLLFFQSLLDGGEFYGATGISASNFRCPSWLLKLKWFRHHLRFFCHLRSMIPRAISGCQNQESNPYHSFIYWNNKGSFMEKSWYSDHWCAE